MSDQFEVPPIDVLPKPVQAPHPPLFLIGWSLDDARRAGASGLGYLDVSGGDDEILEMHKDGYVAARASADPNDLVCVSSFAAVGAFEPGADSTARMRRWESMGFDEAIARLEPIDETAEKAKDQVRFMASEIVGLH